MTYIELEKMKKEKNVELNYIKNIIKTSKTMRDELTHQIYEIEQKQLEVMKQALKTE